MISKIFGNNYKAFESFEFDLAPITVLLGANSCGKSALINLLLMLSQTADNINNSDSALRLNGNKVGMGEALNLIRGKNEKTSIDIGFEFSNKTEFDTTQGLTTESIIERYYYLFRTAEHIFRRQRTIKNNNEFNNEYLSNIDKYMFKIADGNNEKYYNELYSSLSDSIKKYRKISTNLSIEDQKDSFIDRFSESDYFLKNVSYVRLKEWLLELEKLKHEELNPKEICYKFKYIDAIGELEISSFKIKNLNEKTIIHVIKKDGFKQLEIKSDIFNEKTLAISEPLIRKNLNFKSLSLIDANQKTLKENPYAEGVINVINKVTNVLIRELKETKINHVSPLRAFPRRYYLLEKSAQHTFLNALEGTDLAEILKKREDIKNKINLHLAVFDLAIDVEKVNDIIHKITVTQGAVNLELTDVGFGISQVIPIIVQAYLCPPESTTIIEQPEIHLHPKMQAWLTDALVKIAINENKKFIIETHSESIIRRLRLRLVDTKSNLELQHLKIYHLERNSHTCTTTINEVALTEYGDIEWPKGFMDIEIEDTIKIQAYKASLKSLK
ncbi:AAA family ATPase [Shewanella sp. SW32]|uniref:AAA family ATPase n=1 Tax=unclassified Shewanella TaxID=196818 RepID=UPI0021D9E8E1|nr:MULTISPECIES: AAA family ATPase [unclassified Shewanella]MCU7964397.1 AAA family ATPase [Shewanella sp. SW32]MCU7972301.1 AAA family ATPase [Shewanella sp. SW29]